MEANATSSFPSLISGAFLTTLGAGIGYLGAWSSNRAAQLRQSDQLNHDAKQRELERVHHLIKEVALEMGEAITQCQTQLLNLVQANTKERVVELVNFDHLLRVLTKIYLVGNSEVVAKARSITTKFAQGTSELTKIQLEVAGAHESIKENQAVFNQIMKREIELNDKLRSLDNNSPDRSTIESECQGNKIWREETSRHTDSLYSAYYAASKKAMKQYAELLPAFQSESMGLLVAIRKQLGIQTTDEDISALLSSGIDKGSLTDGSLAST